MNAQTAFRLAWMDGDGYRTSQWAYAANDAAMEAAPVLNRVRMARGIEPYSHVIVYDGQAPVDVVPLEAAV